MKDKKMYILLVISILFAIVGVSLAFFSLNIIGNDNAKDTKITTGDLELVFTDDNEVSLDGAFPGDSITKTISVKNTGTKEVSYNIVWQELLNEITNNELVIDGTCKNLNSSNTEDGECSAISKKAVKEDNITSNIPIKPGYTQEYEVKITFIDTGKPQNYNKNKSFKGKLGLTESSAKTIYCTYDGELTQGAEYVNGQYTYRYMQEGFYDFSGFRWNNMNEDGWGIQLTDKTSTNVATSNLCTYINNKPVVSMSYMFYDSQATTIDISNFNTSNVTSMSGMFGYNQVTTIDLSSFDTSNVTNMSSMFVGSQAATLNLSNFDTSNATSMSGMFMDSQATTINISNFDTSNVIDMSDMFDGSQVVVLDLSNFNTSKVTDMYQMFAESNLKTLDLSNFNTSKVTNMYRMFAESNLKTLDLSNFNTSNVTNMYEMFGNSKIVNLDVSNFDTKKVINMGAMFADIQVSVLDLSSFDTSNVEIMNDMFGYNNIITTIYVSEKFNINDNVPTGNMFQDCTSLVGGAGTTYDANYVDKTYARIDGGTSNPGYFTDIADK